MQAFAATIFVRVFTQNEAEHIMLSEDSFQLLKGTEIVREVLLSITIN